MARSAGRQWVRVAWRAAGPLQSVTVVAAYAVVWLLAYPRELGWAQGAGEFLGALAVVCFALALVLMSSTRWIETLFAGLDRAAIWHRGLAIVGGLLLLAHALVTGGGYETRVGKALAVGGFAGIGTLIVWAMLPRWRALTPAATHALVERAKVTRVGRLLDRFFAHYELWRGVHRLLGLCVLAGMVHALLDSEVFGGSALLRLVFLAVCVIGMGAYAYRELVAPFFVQVPRYRVRSLTPLSDGESYALVLAPQAKPLAFRAGQWAMVSIETKEGWTRNPFTLAGAEGDSDLTFVVKGAGDFTRRIGDLVRPGMPAVVDGPHGRFDRAAGGRRQVWIGAGSGVTPFLSWLRSLGEADRGRDVDVWLLSRGPSPFADELAALVADHPGVRLHLHDSAAQGRLTAAGVLAGVERPGEVSYFLSGPTAMKRAFARDLRAASVRGHRVHMEHVDWR